MKDEYSGREVALEEAVGVWKRQYESIDILKQTAKTLLGASSFLIALIGALKLMDISHPSTAYIYLAISTGICYLVQTFFCLRVLSPVETHAPIKANFEFMKNMLFDLEQKQLLEKLLERYLDAISKNTPIVKKRAQEVRIATYLFPVILISIFALGLLT